MRKIIFILTMLGSFNVFAAKLTVVPNGPAAIVTAGVPFKKCALIDPNNFRLVDESGVEVPVFVKPTLFWPSTACSGVTSIRAIKIQFSHTKDTPEVYSWSFAPRSGVDLTETPVNEVETKIPTRVGYKEPGHFAINDAEYLVSAELIPPTTVAGKNDYDNKWYPAAFAKRVETLDFSSTKGERWLFDSVSTIYQQALRTGALEQYREAYLEHEFYMANMEVEDSSTVGRWKLAKGDIKYVYLTPVKLHLALTGDDSWVPMENGIANSDAKDRDTWIRTIARKSLNAQAIGKPYTKTAVRFTERETGFALQQLLAAYELTNDAELFASLRTAVDNLHDMMNSNPDGLGNHGYLSHSWDAHEGSYYGYIGRTPVFSGSDEETQTSDTFTIRHPIGDDFQQFQVGSAIAFKPYGPKNAVLAEPLIKNADGTLTMKLAAPVSIRSNQWAIFVGHNKTGTESLNLEADRIFSPWMQAVIADGLWQFYNLTDDVDLRIKIGDLLLGFGRAVTAFGIDSKGLAPDLKKQIESAFQVTVHAGSISSSRGVTPHTRYAANYLMGQPDISTDYINYINYDGGGNADQHSPESLFQIALAINFETDPDKKAAMMGVAEALTAWFASRNMNKTLLKSHPARYFNWTNKTNPWGTYQYVMGLQK